MAKVQSLCVFGFVINVQILHEVLLFFLIQLLTCFLLLLNHALIPNRSTTFLPPFITLFFPLCGLDNGVHFIYSMNMDENISEKQVTEEKSKNLKSLETYLKFGGFAGIIFGLIHAWSIISQGFTPIRLGDAIINTAIGILFLVSARLLSNRKR